MATINQVVEEMQKRYPEASVELKEITKTNETLTGLTIHTAGEPVSPTMYLNEEEIEKLELNMVCDGLQKTYEDHKGVIDPEIISDIRSFEAVADKIKVKAINTEWNKGFLSGVPSLKFADLSLIFYIDLGGDFKNCGTATVTVTDEIAGIWGKSVEEIYAVAAENTRKETAILRMGEVLREAGYEDLTPPGSPELLIVTNKDRLNGGGVLPVVLDRLKEKLGKFLAIPSSVHEWIILTDDGEDCRSELDGLVREVTSTQVDRQEQLSLHAYHSDELVAAL